VKITFDVKINGAPKKVEIDHEAVVAIGKILGDEIGLAIKSAGEVKYDRAFSKKIYTDFDYGTKYMEVKLDFGYDNEWRETISRDGHAKISECQAALQEKIIKELDNIYAGLDVNFYPVENGIKIQRPDRAFVEIRREVKKRSIKGVKRKITDELRKKYGKKLSKALKESGMFDSKIKKETIMLEDFFDTHIISYIEEAEITIGLSVNSIDQNRLEQIKKSLRMCMASAQAKFFPGALDKFFDGIDEEEVDELITDLAGSKLFNNALMGYIVKKYPEVAKKCARKQVIRNEQR
jgi:hypothetical protein